MFKPNGAVLFIERLCGRPLSVPLVEPFAIASGSIDTTRAVEVEARVVWNGESSVGLGEAACLPPVTGEDQPDALAAVDHAAKALAERQIAASGDQLQRVFESLEHALAEILAASPVARAGVESAVLDAMARIARMPLRAFLGGQEGTRTVALESDITVPIAEPERMAAAARAWAERGFRTLKIKVGRNVDDDARALEAIGRAAPRAKLRIDANAGYSATEAIGLAHACDRIGLAVECWEQPCAANDLEGMARVAATLRVPVIADESVRNLEDLTRVGSLRAAQGVNLKLAKMGGLLPAYRIGLVARARGLKLMAGGMVETRLGMTAGAHLACALGGVDFVDLDTAWLLREDPYEGGYEARGPHYTMPSAPGLGVRRRVSAPGRPGNLPGTG